MTHHTKIMAIATQKGGSGKSTLTHILSLALSGKTVGKKVMVIDADAQGSIRGYVQFAKKSKKNAELKPSYDFEAVTLEDLREVLKKNYGKYDYIFIDLPGTIHLPGVRTAFIACDLVFIPVLPSRDDFDAAINTMKLLQEIKEYKQENQSDLNFYCFVNQAEPNRVSSKMLIQAMKSNNIPSFEKPIIRYEKYKSLTNDVVNILDNKDWATEELALNAFVEEFVNVIDNN